MSESVDVPAHSEPGDRGHADVHAGLASPPPTRPLSADKAPGQKQLPPTDGDSSDTDKNRSESPLAGISKLPDTPEAVVQWIRQIAFNLRRSFNLPDELEEELVSEGLVRYYEVLPNVKADMQGTAPYYMYLHIRGRMLDSLERVVQIPVRLRHATRQKVHADTNLTAREDKLSTEETQRTTFRAASSAEQLSEEQIDARIAIRKVNEIVRTLPPLARALVLEPALNGGSLREIGARHGVSKAKAFRERQKALNNIRDQIGSSPGLVKEHRQRSTSLPEDIQQLQVVAADLTSTAAQQISAVKQHHKGASCSDLNDSSPISTVQIKELQQELNCLYEQVGLILKRLHCLLPG